MREIVPEIATEKAPVSILKSTKPATMTHSTESVAALRNSPGVVNYNLDAAHERRLSSTAREYNPNDFENTAVLNSTEQLQKIGSNLTTSRKKRKIKSRFPQHEKLDVSQLNLDSARGSYVPAYLSNSNQNSLTLTTKYSTLNAVE